jgi:hypothetical protein
MATVRLIENGIVKSYNVNSDGSYSEVEGAANWLARARCCQGWA